MHVQPAVVTEYNHLRAQLLGALATDTLPTDVAIISGHVAVLKGQSNGNIDLYHMRTCVMSVRDVLQRPDEVSLHVSYQRLHGEGRTLLHKRIGHDATTAHYSFLVDEATGEVLGESHGPALRPDQQRALEEWQIAS